MTQSSAWRIFSHFQASKSRYHLSQPYDVHTASCILQSCLDTGRDQTITNMVGEVFCERPCQSLSRLVGFGTLPNHNCTTACVLESLALNGTEAVAWPSG